MPRAARGGPRSWEIEIQANLDDVLGVLDRKNRQARARAGIGDIVSPVVDEIPLGLDGPIRAQEHMLHAETYQPTQFRLADAHTAFGTTGASMRGGKVVVRFRVTEAPNGRAGLGVQQSRAHHVPDTKCE